MCPQIKTTKNEVCYMAQIFQWHICNTGSVSLSQSTLPDICLTESSIADLQGIYQQGCFYNTLVRLSIFP